MQASHTYFVAKYLGYDVAMYDSSMSEWVGLEGSEVVKG
ncbi:MAG: sulfurtransferase, partial [Acidobacteria bacterium]|nr:sulfurtransferase [Acidobacteriota bacterium]